MRPAQYLNRLGQVSRSHKMSFHARRTLLVTMVLAQAAFLWGCSGIVSGKNTQAAPPPPQTYSISGTISPAAGGAGATVTLSGVTAATTTANSSGNYTFSGLSNGTYAVTPSLTGYTFSPNVQSAIVNGANVTGLNFTAATAQQAHSVALTWNPSTSAVAGYNVYRTTVSGVQYARLNSSLVGGLAYTDATVVSGSSITYYYVTTAVDSSGSESIPSNEVPAKVP
jgi:hypothetical protein